MLSVNIPVYNIEVNDLIHQIARQCAHLHIDFEIRIYDDGSQEEIKAKNRSLAKLSQVVYKEMPVNYGRSAIRNRMGSDSEKDYLLFIDADSKVTSERYVETYLRHATPGCVLCGGTSYPAEPPADGKKLLRWVYGCKREAITAEERNKNKGFILTSNNFLIDRKVFQQTCFREDIGPYGHEDTLLGYDLYKKGVHPLHINNPVEHTGLEDSMVFIVKTGKALENLLVISDKLLKGKSDFSGKIKFLNRYRKLTRFCPPFVIRLFFNLFKQHMEQNLTGRKPLLMLYDLYKVGYFASLKKGK
ncbi:MAG: glycosyltransferase family 2 protein [Bacteroidota bacterium]